MDNIDDSEEDEKKEQVEENKESCTALYGKHDRPMLQI